jgi:hypothetical protein
MPFESTAVFHAMLLGSPRRKLGLSKIEALPETRGAFDGNDAPLCQFPGRRADACIAQLNIDNFPGLSLQMAVPRVRTHEMHGALANADWNGVIGVETAKV